MIRQLLVLGASRDLAGRSLLPAPARLHEPGRLPEPLMARDHCDTAALRRQVEGRLQRRGW
jgi:glucose-6-phosphate 1-dehydrogenase